MGWELPSEPNYFNEVVNLALRDVLRIGGDEMLNDGDTIPSPPPEDCALRDDFVSRMMRLPPSVGQRKLSTWERDHAKDPRFNARGCR